jgi:CheY-like chemotaxis protein
METNASRSNRGRVLVVDDNIDGAEMLAELLRARGYEVDLAHDGSAALARFDAFEPHIAILDLGLPEIDGFDLARRVRTDPRFATTPLIALTAYAEPHDRARARDAGFDHHLAKPADLDHLCLLLATLRPATQSS